MNRLAGLTFGLALGLGMVGQGPAQAGPFSHAAELRSEGALPIEEVASRRVRRNRGLAAGAIIGGAIIGGAIIAESQRRRNYYVDDGYYYDRRYPGTYNPQYDTNPSVDRPFYSGDRRNRGTYNPQYDTNPSVDRPFYSGDRYYRGRTVRDPAGGGSMR
ncbi:MAG: hypothetical protein ACOVOC_11190 [Rhabdaerophilum sp.]